MTIKHSILVFLFGALTAGPALSDTLHGFCVSPAPACADNGNITPTSTNPPDFGFQSSGTTQGNFELLLLVPNNADVSPSTYSLSVNGTNLTNTLVSSSLFSATAFTSGKLDGNPGGYLGVSYSPSNALSAFLPNTQAVDAGATGYYVYLFNFGAETGDPKNQGTAPIFTIASGTVDVGSIFLGLEFTGSNIFTGNIFGASQPTGAILVADPSSASVPEPATLGLVGLVLLGLGLARKRVMARN